MLLAGFTMKRTTAKALAFLSLAALAPFIGGCALPPDSQEWASASFGELPANWQEMVKSATNRILIDPTSPIYTFRMPRKACFRGGLLAGGGKTYGWAIEYYVNAKNSFGGYTGDQRQYAMITNDGQCRLIASGGSTNISYME